MFTFVKAFAVICVHVCVCVCVCVWVGGCVCGCVHVDAISAILFILFLALVHICARECHLHYSEAFVLLLALVTVYMCMYVCTWMSFTLSNSMLYNFLRLCVLVINALNACIQFAYE